MAYRSKVTKKKCVGVRKKPPQKKPVGNALAATSEETNLEPAKATYKADTMAKDEDNSDKPARNTRAATKNQSKQGSTESLDDTSTAPTTVTTSKRYPNEPADKTSAATKESSSEPVNISSEDDVPLASLKRKGATEDKWTETTDLPRLKSSKLDKGSSPRPFRKIRQLKMLDELESEGWDIKDFNIELCCIDPVDLSRIPSPLANLADDTERIMRIINNHVHPQLSFLFHCIYDGNNGEFAELMNLLDKSPPGAFGAFHGDGMGPQFFAVPPNKPKFSLLLDRRNGSEHRTHLEIRASRNARTGEIGYFVVNEQRNLHINENLIARNSVAGPLPDFAVIQIGYWVVFWWRSRAAMGYVPEMVSQVVKDVEEDDATEEPSLSHPSARSRVGKGADAAEESVPSLSSGSEEGEIPKVPTRPAPRLPKRPPTSWKEILDSGLQRHNRQRTAAGNRLGYHGIKSPSGMDMDDVLFAVATFWEPLRKRGTDFAFAGADVIDENLRQQFLAGHIDSFGVVGEGNVFIMPLIIPPIRKNVGEGSEKLPESKGFNFESFENSLESKENGPITRGRAKKDKAKTDAPTSPSPLGHLLLAVVEKDSKSHVKIDILDSLTQHVDRDVIRIRAMEVARIWLKTDAEAKFHFKSVPQQPLGSNACGLYVILNAWAIMLDIRPISLHSHDQSRPGGCGSDEFVEDGMNIVNLALAGCMDSKTVRAFLNHYGYTNVKVGVSLEREGDPENGVQAVEMNRGLFTHALEQAEGHSPESIDGIQLRSPSPLSAAPSTPSNGTLGLQDAISEDSTGLGDAVSENSGSQGALPENNPGLLGAFHETPSLRGVLPEDNLDPHDGLFGIQDQPLEEFRRVSEQAPSNTPYLQNMLKYQQIMGGAQTDDTGYQAAIDKSRTQQFMDQAPGATPEEAKSCLEDAKGDLDEAMFLFALRQSLDGPDEEEAS